MIRVVSLEFEQKKKENVIMKNLTKDFSEFKVWVDCFLPHFRFETKSYSWSIYNIDAKRQHSIVCCLLTTLLQRRGEEMEESWLTGYIFCILWFEGYWRQLKKVTTTNELNSFKLNNEQQTTNNNQQSIECFVKKSKRKVANLTSKWDFHSISNNSCNVIQSIKKLSIDHWNLWENLNLFHWFKQNSLLFQVDIHCKSSYWQFEIWWWWCCCCCVVISCIRWYQYLINDQHYTKLKVSFKDNEKYDCVYVCLPFARRHHWTFRLWRTRLSNSSLGASPNPIPAKKCKVLKTNKHNEITLSSRRWQTIGKSKR
jgi:hypothetical protein